MVFFLFLNYTSLYFYLVSLLFFIIFCLSCSIFQFIPLFILHVLSGIPPKLPFLVWVLRPTSNYTPLNFRGLIEKSDCIMLACFRIVYYGILMWLPCNQQEEGEGGKERKWWRDKYLVLLALPCGEETQWWYLKWAKSLTFEISNVNCIANTSFQIPSMNGNNYGAEHSCNYLLVRLYVH